jgi:two-component system CheB/CheR fusion protein
MGVDSSDDFERIRLLVRRRKGIDIDHYRRSYIQRRIRTRMRARDAHDPAAYARLLARDADETAHLLGAISTSVTSFFRDPALYTYLDARVLPEILPAPPGRTVRIWSAGCATGEEAYSLAALVAGRDDPSRVHRLRVLGTDVDRHAISVARKGEYPFGALKRVPADLQRRWFSAAPGEDLCRVSRALKAYTSFRVESLDRKPPAGAFDLIFCRNVFIYFDPPLQERILQHFARALRPGGYLALGRVERVMGPAKRHFETVHAKERIYRKL